VGNRSSVACFDWSFVDEVGRAFPWGQFDVATIQVGRTVVIIEIARVIFGSPVARDADVEGIMTRVADRADRAQRNLNINVNAG
jgi:hypothetical protein